MRKIIPLAFGIIIVLSAVYIVKLSSGKPDKDILEIGTFVVLTLTLIVLVFYAYNTNLLASIGQLRWERESILNATYEMVEINDTGEAGRTLFRIKNPSTLIIRAKVWCDFKIYGSNVEAVDDFNGKNTWLLFPQQTSQGWFEIAPLLEKKGKTPHQMIQEYTSGNRTTQLTMDLTIEFRDELSQKRRLPTRKHYFAFNELRWIPYLTESNGWD